MGFFNYQFNDREETNTLYAKQFGCKVCPLNKMQQTKPSGSDKPNIYFVNSIGMSLSVSDRLMRSFNYDIHQMKIRYNSVVRCNGDMKKHENFILECCVSKLNEDIKECNPDIVVGIGSLALKWAMDEKIFNSESDWRGRLFPIKIKDKVFQYFQLEDTTIFEDYKFKSQQHIFKLDCKKILTIIQSDSLTPVVEDPIDYFKGITLFGKDDFYSIKNALYKFSQLDSVALDIETTAKLPYNKESKIITVSVGTHNNTIAFPLFHPNLCPDDQERIADIFKWFLSTPVTKVCHNLVFELEWLSYFFGKGIIYKSKWSDTMAQAYTLDQRIGNIRGYSPLSLNMLTRLYFGFQLKSISDIDVSRLLDYPMITVLKYNALDVKYTHKLYLKQQEILVGEGRLQSHSNYLDATAKNLAHIQRKGVAVDEIYRRRLSRKLIKELTKISHSIYTIPEVEQYKNIVGKFDILSSHDVASIFREYFGLQSNSVDEYTLKQYAESKNKLARLIIDYRKAHKLKSTYVDCLVNGEYENLKGKIKIGHICDDGLIHARFNHLITRTNRLSSNNPNLQNFPNPTNLNTRSSIIPPEGNNTCFVKFDFGQLEARNICMASKDSKFTQNILNDHDIHYDWGIRLAKKYPKVCNERYFNNISEQKLKKLRSSIKNKVIFPWFYEGSAEILSRGLNVPGEVANELYGEFWIEYSVIKKWHKKIINFYNRHGYVETLYGSRRYGPLRGTNKVNSVIQGTASMITVRASNRLGEIAYHLNDDQLHPVLNIHDDLTFCISKNRVNELIPIIAKEMCRTEESWMGIVPLQVAVCIGSNFGNTEEVSKFDTRDFNYEVA